MNVVHNSQTFQVRAGLYSTHRSPGTGNLRVNIRLKRGEKTTSWLVKKGQHCPRISSYCDWHTAYTGALIGNNTYWQHIRLILAHFCCSCFRSQTPFVLVLCSAIFTTRTFPTSQETDFRGYKFFSQITVLLTTKHYYAIKLELLQIEYQVQLYSMASQKTLSTENIKQENFMSMPITANYYHDCRYRIQSLRALFTINIIITVM